jgi:hypothetical protein
MLKPTKAGRFSMASRRFMVVSRSFIALALALAGCSSTGLGESSASACNDGLDNDNDELWNCQDPDCQAHEHCRTELGIGVRQPPPVVAGKDGSVSAPIDASFVADAHTDGDAPADEDAGGVDAHVPTDAGGPPCDGRCGMTQACIQDVCQDRGTPTAGTFELRIVSVQVPDFNMWGQCLDPCFDSVLPSFAFCVCTPDPYVEVLRVRNGDGGQSGTLIGSTPVAINTREARFANAPLTVELAEGDALQFVVRDEDPGSGDNTIIYTCLPDLRTLTPGPIECSDTVVRFLPPYAIRAELQSIP